MKTLQINQQNIYNLLQFNLSAFINELTFGFGFVWWIELSSVFLLKTSNEIRDIRICLNFHTK